MAVGEEDFSHIKASYTPEADLVGPHAVDDVVNWAIRLLEARDTRNLTALEGMRQKAIEHGRLIVMRYPDGSEHGVIGVVFPTDDEVSQVLVALERSGTYVMEPIPTNNDRGDGAESEYGFLNVFYPNKKPIEVVAPTVEAAEERLLGWVLPHNKTTLLCSRFSAHRDAIRDAIDCATKVAQQVDFIALRNESMNEADDLLFRKLGGLADRGDEL